MIPLNDDIITTEGIENFTKTLSILEITLECCSPAVDERRISGVSRLGKCTRQMCVIVIKDDK